MYKSIITSLLLLLAFTSSANSEAPTSEEFSKSMDAYLKDDANMDKLAKSLEDYFRKKQAKMQEEKQLADQKALEEQIKNPIDVPIGNSPTKGPADAKITIVEFSDFQCPYCSKGSETLDELAKEYPGQIRFVFKNLPLAFHPEAEPAAKAALAAGEQGKFWEMHNLLFKNQQGLKSDLYPKLAKELGLDVDKFKADFGKEGFKNLIDSDSKLAKELGISGTPAFVVNGVMVKGARPAGYFKEIISKTAK